MTRVNRTVNRVELQGYVGRDAEQKSEKAPIRFSLATGNDNKPDGSGKFPLVFHNIVVWNKPEAIGIRKGDFVRIMGRLNYTKWTTKDGSERSGVEIVAFEIKMPRDDEQKKPITPNLHGVPISDHDIPF